jgi:hypothetical protein
MCLNGVVLKKAQGQFYLYSRKLVFRTSLLLDNFPYFEKEREAYEITLLSVFISVCVYPSVCMSPLIVAGQPAVGV